MIKHNSRNEGPAMSIPTTLCPSLYIKLLQKMGQNFLDRQYILGASEITAIL